MVIDKCDHLFCYPAAISHKDGTIYVNFTSKFLIRLLDGMMAIFILYDGTSNVILTTPVKDSKDETVLSTVKKNTEY